MIIQKCYRYNQANTFIFFNNNLAGGVKVKYLKYFILLLFIAACVPGPYAESFKNATSLIEQNSYERAYVILKDICTKEPNNEQFCGTLQKVKDKLFARGMANVNSKFETLKGASPIIPIPALADLEKDVNDLREYRDPSTEINGFLGKIQTERGLTQDKIDKSLSEVEARFGEKKYREMFEIIMGIKMLDPPSISQTASKYSEAIMNDLYPQITESIKNDDWKKARESLELALLINPDYKDVRTLINEAREKDTAQYFIDKAEEAKAARKFQEALDYYEKAAAYPETKDQVAGLLQRAKIEFINYWFVLGTESMDQDLYSKAFDYFHKALSNLKTMPLPARQSISIPAEELNRFYGELFNRAQASDEGGHPGAAYLYYRLIYKLSPGYPDLKKNMQAIEDKLTKRAVKSLAVMPFQSPKDSPDIGSVFTSSIILNLHQELSNDIKIIEREAVDALLKEYEITVASGSSDKDIAGLQISATNYLLLGEVLTSGVETTVQDANNTARVKVGSRDVANPEYEQWARMYGERFRKGEDVPGPPPRMIAEDVFENISYKTKYYKKIAYLTISYRIVDTSRGKIIHTSVVETNKEVKDESNEGVQIGEFKLPLKLAKLPSDIEMSKLVQKDVLDKVMTEIKGIFINSENKFLAEAEQLEKEENISDSIERYSDAIMIMKKKDLKYENIEERLYKYLDVVSSY